MYVGTKPYGAILWVYDDADILRVPFHGKFRCQVEAILREIREQSRLKSSYFLFNFR